MKKLLLILLCALLAVSCLVMTACGEDTCTAHVDADENGKCDNCGADVEPEIKPCVEHSDEDGDYLCDKCGAAVIPEGPAEVNVTFNVKDDSGVALAGITVILANADDEKYNLTTTPSDANGKITAKVYTGTYGVYFDYDTDALGYYIGDTDSITVNADTTVFDLILIDNNPNGTIEKPYIISAGENSFTIPAGTSYNYIIYRAVNLYFNAAGATGAKVTYGEAEYTADADGKIVFALLGTDTNSAEMLSIANTTDAEITITVEINSAPGTYGNPLVIDTLGEAIATTPIAKGDTVYYTYTVEGDGIFSIEPGAALVYISMLNTTNSKSVNTASDIENGNIELTVKKGDVIIIDVSVTAGTEAVSVSFTPSLSVPTIIERVDQ